MKKLTLRSGGQSGVDRAALDFAIQHDWPYLGWCPRGGWAEDFPEPPGVLAKYPGLIETPTATLEQRTAWNVRDSQATIILVQDEDSVKLPGVSFTWLSAEVIFVRPWLRVDLTEANHVTPAREWLTGLVNESNESEFVLNVAGPRELASPGIYDRAMRFLNDLFGS